MQLRDIDEEPSPDDLYTVGTVAEILRYITAPDGTHHVVCQGVQRFRVKKFLSGYPFLVARIEHYEEPEESSKDIEARVITLKQKALEVLTQRGRHLMSWLMPFDPSPHRQRWLT